MTNILAYRITLEDIAQRCEKVRRSGPHSFTACCVGHDDHNPSMTVTETEGGKILVHCFAGCPQEVLLDALGLGKRDYRATVKPIRRTESVSPTAEYARRIWSEANDDDGVVSGHAYALRKHIGHACGARRGTASGRLIGRDADCIVIPNRDWDGNLAGVECVNGEGTKQTFGSKGLLVLGHPEAAPLVHVCEGWATGYAISKLFPLQFACVVAFGKSRLEAYARAAQVRFHGTIAVHEDSPENRDVWDLWAAGEGEQYARRVRSAVHV